eukprot:749671-Hanusia_phi.AAC.2
MLIQKLENAHYDDWNHGERCCLMKAGSDMKAGGKEVEEESDQSTDKTCTVHSFTSVRKIAKADRSKVQGLTGQTEKNVIRQATAVLERGEGPPTEKIKVGAVASISTCLTLLPWADEAYLHRGVNLAREDAALLLPADPTGRRCEQIFGVEEVPEDKHRCKLGRTRRAALPSEDKTLCLLVVMQEWQGERPGEADYASKVRRGVGDPTGVKVSQERKERAVRSARPH